jgi:hypothetical protein
MLTIKAHEDSTLRLCSNPARLLKTLRIFEFWDEAPSLFFT